MNAPRQALGSFFRSLVEFLEARGFIARVRAQVSPQTRALIDKPPRALGFMPSGPIDEIEEALGRVAGDEVLVECGLVCSRSLGWTLIQPVLRMAFHLFGQSPRPVFENLDRFFSMATRGISFSWEPGEQGGVALAKFDGEGTPAAAYHVLRGTLLFVFEASGTEGAVGPPQVVETTPGFSVVRYAVSWK